MSAVAERRSRVRVPLFVKLLLIFVKLREWRYLLSLSRRASRKDAAVHFVTLWRKWSHERVETWESKRRNSERIILGNGNRYYKKMKMAPLPCIIDTLCSLSSAHSAKISKKFCKRWESNPWLSVCDHWHVTTALRSWCWTCIQSASLNPLLCRKPLPGSSFGQILLLENDRLVSRIILV